MKNKRGVIISLFAALLLCMVALLMFLTKDHTGPVISVNSSIVKPYAAADGDSVLKSFVKAEDSRDGDVSNTIIVENTYLVDELHKIKVVYTARDKSNNVTKLSCVFDYRPTDEERNALSVNKEEQETNNSNEGETQKATNQSTQEKATNSSMVNETQVSTETIKQSGDNPVITFTTTKVTLKAGQTFNVVRYLKDIKDDKDTKEELSRRIIVNGEVNNNKAGTYKLDIYCTDTDKNPSNHIDFQVTIE